MTAIIRFHERRAFLLECLRVILSESFEVEREGTQAIMQETVGQILQIHNGPLRNGSLFTRKCLDAMVDIEKWLVLLGDQIQKASIVGQAQESDIMEIIEFQRQSLLKQHESLGTILHFLFKGSYASSEDLRKLLEKLRKMDKFDLPLVHYIPAVISSFAQYGSPDGQGQYQEARSLHQAITDSKEPYSWALPKLHAAAIVFWLAEYAGWYFDNGPASSPQGTDPTKEAANLSKMFLTALDDGAFEFILEICAGMDVEERDNPARNELVGLLLKDGTSLTAEPDDVSPHFRDSLITCVELFTESLIANMPDTIRMLKSEEDLRRLDQITALREGLTSNLHRGLVEARMHLESLLLIIAFAFERRPDAAQEFWTDPDGNLHGFLLWSSKRQTVPRASAFCEMLCSISEGAENALFAHRFLLDEDKHLPTKLRRSTSMSWSQMLAELQLYSTKASERQPTTQPSVLRLRKIDNADIHEPESPVMLTCYLRLISHLCRQSPDVRKWILEHPTINVSSMLLALCNAPIPNHLRAAIFVTLRCLMIDRTAAHGNEMWQLIDQWTSGSGLSSTTLPKSPAISTNVSLVWNERNAFQRIAEGFDQTRAFVELLNNLVCPASDAAVSQLCLTFPESLGSSYRMPGIEPYVDFVMGQAFATRSAALDDKESRGLRLSCLQFVATCLQSFNESLVSVAVQQPLAASSLLRSSSISTYIRLHPFYRVMEWLFNEEIIRVLFQAAHQDIEEVGKSRPGSILLDSLIRSIDVMNLIVDNQATYFELSRLGTKSQPQPGSSNIASSSLASFEDSVMDNLSLITDLCLYCGPGHPQLTLTSLALLEKLSGSRKLNKSSTMTTRWQPVSQIVELLNSSNGIEGVARSLTLQMSPDIREIEGGPGTAGHLIKGGLLNLLSRCLQMINDKPSMAHILLGFSCVGNALDIPTDGLFEHRASLFHAIVEFVQSYPEGNGQSIVWWMLHLRRLGLQVLQHLWSSPLSAGFVLRELRAAQLLRVLFIGHQTVTISTLWDGIPITAPQFWYENSAESLREFFAYRGLLFNYATTELRSAARESPPSLQRSVLGTLLGRSFDEQGTTIPHPSIFDLFDFVDLDIVEDVGIPALTFFRDFDPEIFAKQQEDAPVTLYDLDAVQEFLQLVGDDLLETGRISPQDNEQLLLEAENVIALLRARNCNRQVLYNRFIALKSWTELASTIVVTCDLEPSRMAMLILQVFQLILPKLEQSVERNNAEAVELARLAETLINKLDAVTSTTSEDVIEERMYSLFQACIHAIPLALELSDLRQIFYHICTTYLSRITRFGASHSRFGHRAQQTVKASGSGLFEILCDDAFSGTESCRISALLLLSLLAVLDHQQDSSLLVTVIVQSNYLGIFLDVVRGMATEFRNASAAGKS
jgi:nuclear pore complex protein Nup205